MDADWAWAAGLFEGEGSAVAVPRRVALTVTSTDRDVLERYGAIISCGRLVSLPPRPSPWKPCFSWEVYRSADILRIIERFLPWLCTRRAEQIHRLRVRWTNLPDPANGETCEYGERYGYGWQHRTRLKEAPCARCREWNRLEVAERRARHKSGSFVRARSGRC